MASLKMKPENLNCSSTKTEQECLTETLNLLKTNNKYHFIIGIKEMLVYKSEISHYIWVMISPEKGWIAIDADSIHELCDLYVKRHDISEELNDYNLCYICNLICKSKQNGYKDSTIINPLPDWFNNFYIYWLLKQ